MYSEYEINYIILFCEWILKIFAGSSVAGPESNTKPAREKQGALWVSPSISRQNINKLYKNQDVVQWMFYWLQRIIRI